MLWAFKGVPIYCDGGRIDNLVSHVNAWVLPLLLLIFSCFYLFLLLPSFSPTPTSAPARSPPPLTPTGCRPPHAPVSLPLILHLLPIYFCLFSSSSSSSIELLKIPYLKHPLNKQICVWAHSREPFKASFSFYKITPKYTQMTTLYTIGSVYIIFTMI